MIYTNFSKIIYSFFILFSLIILFFFYTRGFIYHDEGYILHSAQLVNQGKIPYKDFHFAYTPLSIYITLVGFKVFGESVLASRFIALIISVFTSYFIFLLVKEITKEKIFQFLAVFLYLSWGPTHTNFVWPVMIVIFTGLAACYFLILGIKQKKTFYFFLAGVITVLTFLTKQNFGPVLFINSIGVFFFFKDSKKISYLLNYFLGLTLTFFVFIAYLFQTGSLNFFINDFYYYTIKRIVLDNTLTTPFLYGSNLIEKIFKVLLYTFPFTISLIAGFIAQKKNKKNIIFLASLSLFYYIAGIRPTTDYIHLSPLIAITGIPLVIIIYFTKNILIKRIFLFSSILLICLGFYSALFKGYYKWEAPLIKYVFFYNNPRINIWVDDRYNNAIPQVLSFINTNTKENEYVFVDDYAPMIYFITNRKNPTMFDVISPDNFYIPYEKEIIKNLKNKKVNIVLTKTDYKNSFISDYILKNYKLVKKTQDFFIWRKKPR